MGLKQLRKLAREKEIEDYLLSHYGITIADLCNLHEVIEKSKKEKPSEIYQPYVLSEQEKKQIKEKSDAAVTAEQMMKTFAGEIEEFYPDGQRPKKNNN